MVINTLRFPSWLTLWVLFSGAASAETKCYGSDKSKWTNCVGQVTTPKGQKYIGEFRNGKQTGKGAYIYPHGLKYEGDFINGHYNGQGTLTQPDGAKYVGKFLNSKENGQGIEYGADGAVLRSGFWKDGIFVKDMTNLSPPLPKQGITTPKTEGDVLPADFMAWLSESPDRTHLFSELTNFLIKNPAGHAQEITESDLLETIDGETPEDVDQLFKRMSDAQSEGRSVRLTFKRISDHNRAVFSYFERNLKIGDLRIIGPQGHN